MAQIVVENLSKTYEIAERDPGLLGAARGLFRRRMRVVEALKDVTFSLNEGELLGFIGPNGAGKSTTIKILSGILLPSAGRCEVDGLTPWEDRVRHVARIGVVFGQRSQLWWDLPVIEGFDLLAAIYRVPDAEYKRTRILFLDEPTIGLDAPTKLAVRDIVRTLNREEVVTVILTTHDMHDIEALAERVIVIGNGRLLADTNFETLRADILAERRLHVEFNGPAPEIVFPGVIVRNRDGARAELVFDPRAMSASALVAAIASAHPVRDIHVEEPLIEEVIARFYELHGAQEH